MTTSPRQQAPDAPNRSVGDYTLLSKVGEGGMGVVYLARRGDGQRVALKVLRPHIVGDDEARARLAREVSSLSRIRSRWVAEIIDADPWAPVPYVATRYVPGLSLHDHVIEEGPITGPDLIWFAACLAEGLASVHDVGVLHRDIKPSNVLMEGRTPILIDFGLARVADDPKLTHTGWLLGTPGYLAPEILHGDDAAAAADIHSWAATVAYAGLGHAPFGRGPSMAIMDRVRRGDHDLSGLPQPLRDVVSDALNPEPERRPTLDQLLSWLRPQVAQPRRTPEPARPPVEDVYTLPLALAAEVAASEDTTARFEEPTRVETQHDHPPVAPQPVPQPQQYAPQQYAPQPWDQPVPVSFAERTRRAVLLAGLGGVTALVGALYPWIALAGVLLLVWVLRSGSLAASAAGNRRRLRGRRWYDGAQLLVAAPWHVVAAVSGTVILALWSIGLAVAAALLCYAVAAPVGVTLVVTGAVLAASLWSGPGSSQVRSPLGRAVNPLAADPRRWLIASGVLVVILLSLVWLVLGQSPVWTPSDRPPFG